MLAWLFSIRIWLTHLFILLLLKRKDLSSSSTYFTYNQQMCLVSSRLVLPLFDFFPIIIIISFQKLLYSFSPHFNDILSQLHCVVVSFWSMIRNDSFECAHSARILYIYIFIEIYTIMGWERQKRIRSQQRNVLTLVWHPPSPPPQQFSLGNRSIDVKKNKNFIWTIQFTTDPRNGAAHLRSDSNCKITLCLAIETRGRGRGEGGREGVQCLCRGNDTSLLTLKRRLINPLDQWLLFNFVHLTIPHSSLSLSHTRNRRLTTFWNISIKPNT